MAFTLELRPDEVEQFELGFVLLPEQIEEVCLETMAAVTTLGQWAATSTPGMAGDTGDVDPGTTGGSTDGDDSGSTSIAGTTGPGPIGTSSTTIPPVETATGWTGPIDEEPPAEDASDDGCGCRSDPAHGGLWALLLALAFAARRGATPRRPGGRAGYEL
jgi:MYXO-CTERM domain-containing protein